MGPSRCNAALIWMLIVTIELSSQSNWSKFFVNFFSVRFPLELNWSNRILNLSVYICTGRDIWFDARAFQKKNQTSYYFTTQRSVFLFQFFCFDLIRCWICSYDARLFTTENFMCMIIKSKSFQFQHIPNSKHTHCFEHRCFCWCSAHQFQRPDHYSFLFLP